MNEPMLAVRCADGEWLPVPRLVEQLLELARAVDGVLEAEGKVSEIQADAERRVLAAAHDVKRALFAAGLADGAPATPRLRGPDPVAVAKTQALEAKVRERRAARPNKLAELEAKVRERRAARPNKLAELEAKVRERRAERPNKLAELEVKVRERRAQRPT